MRFVVVVDTNVFVSALLSKHADSATVQILRALLAGLIIPLYHRDILAEYNEVLHRTKFSFNEDDLQIIFDTIRQYGLEVEPTPTGELLPDKDDLVFYEVTMEKRDEDARLITGNLKHYPAREFIVTPSEMLDILRKNGILPPKDQ